MILVLKKIKKKIKILNGLIEMTTKAATGDLETHTYAEFVMTDSLRVVRDV